MRLAFVVLACATSLSACTFSKEIYGPDGKPMHSIQCPGAAQSVAACYEKASQLCGTAGYDILGRNESSSPSSFATATGGTLVASSSSVTTRNIMVRCKAP